MSQSRGSIDLPTDINQTKVDLKEDGSNQNTNPIPSEELTSNSTNFNSENDITIILEDSYLPEKQNETEKYSLWRKW